jgi:Na+-translocating ferredoxin:NAD+ oxidoreductase RnfD subunit
MGARLALVISGHGVLSTLRAVQAVCVSYATVTARTLTIAGGTYPLVLPSIRDPRLHVAAVIITVHVIGQVGLHFEVSVPQILAAIVTCAILEIALTFRSSRAFVWPASAMLTGSGVALILRVVGTPPNQPWTIDYWYVFAAVAGFSLLTKYLIKYRGTHVFNPSNIGLVVAFVVLGSSRVEPLDFWWAPLTNPWMIAAYSVILVGGLLITRRLHLLALAAAFWTTLAIGLGLLAALGHCMVANWAFAPVCGADFWRVVVTSPEVLIFLFFMITDPKTIPAGSVARIAFGILVAITSVLLMAPQTDEFGTKVGLLAGLVVMCALRPLLDRSLPAAKTPADDLRAYVRGDGTDGGEAGSRHGAARLGVLAAGVLLAAVGIVAAGIPARGIVVPDRAEALNNPPTVVDPSTLPPITIGQDVIDYDHTLGGTGMQPVVVSLAQNLELENQALLDRNGSLLTAVDHGDRLDEMQGRLDSATASGATTIAHYDFDAIDVSLLVPFGEQTGLSLGLHGRGTVSEERYAADGTLLDRRSSPFDQTFAMRQATGDRWMLVAVLPGGE